MKSNFKLILIIGLSILGGAVGSFLLFRGADVDVNDGEEVVHGTSLIKTAVKGSVKKVTKISLVKNKGKKSVKIVEVTQSKPGSRTAGFDANDETEEENLTETQKAVLKELQDALDDNNLKRVRKALSKFLAKVENGGLGGNVPVCMRQRAVEALGWFGKDATIDLMQFVADSNEEVASSAFVQFEQSLSDCGLSDHERAKIVTSALTAITDSEQADSLLCQLNDMRNSVKAQTVRDILTKGTDAAKNLILEQMDSYLDEGISDVDGVNKWQAMNPDDPDDGELYGGEK